jgi:DNA-binding NtrC family response regulator
MSKALVIENSPKDAERISRLLEAEQLEPQVCRNGAEAELALQANQAPFAVAFLSIDISGPLSGMELLVRCRKVQPAMPVIVVSGALDSGLAARARVLGAWDFIERPLDDSRIRSCLHDLLRQADPDLPVMDELRSISLGDRGERLVGESSAFLDLLRLMARALNGDEYGVLILGESGTGKELVAKALHRLGPRAGKPWVAVNIGEMPTTLVESALFGHEKGAFTDAREQRQGLLEIAGEGSLFLDEIGDLDLSLQGKLLRVIQEREFRRLGGNVQLKFKARLICATHRDLNRSIQQETFRQDLFHRIKEIVIRVPPLRARTTDIDLLLSHFLNASKENGRPLRFARETLTILRSYRFPGNIRELQNLVRAAVVQCNSDLILPRHLPLEMMEDVSLPAETASSGQPPELRKLFAELTASLPPHWEDLPYREADKILEQAMDRVYLPRLLERTHHNITRAAANAGLDTKTFRKHWRESGLPPLAGDEESHE